MPEDDERARRIAKVKAIVADFAQEQAELAARNDGCPTCGGLEFRGRRSRLAQFGIAAAAVAGGGLGAIAAVAVTKRTKFRCEACGAVRGGD